MEINISVRGLVEFILRAGDIDNRKAASADNAMQEGGRIHRMIQRRMGPEYESEVTMHYIYHMDRYDVVIDGRADGVLTEEPGQQNAVRLLSGADRNTAEAVPDTCPRVTIDEIKGTYHELDRMKSPVPVHLAQAKCYAYFYVMQHELPYIRVRMTYCHMDTMQIRYFHEEYTKKQLSDWFDSVMEKYRKWADFTFEWAPERRQSIQALEFPYEYRNGQKELATYVYQTIYHKRKLFMEAPTGTGKTLAVLFPSVKAVGEELADRIFYLTAKTITASVAEDTFGLLRSGGLRFKTVVLTARDKICFMDEPECNPERCRYARGHYDRINDAMYDLLTHEDSFDRSKISMYAEKYQVCPFEMSLDMSLFSDGIICDYNYVFDPHVYLRRFFQDGVQGNNIFLVDEAHNLLERGRDMYSAALIREDFMTMKKAVKDEEPAIYRALDQCSHTMLEMRHTCNEYQLLDTVDPLVSQLQRLDTAIKEYLENEERRKSTGRRSAKRSKKRTDENVKGQLSLLSLLQKNEENTDKNDKNNACSDIDVINEKGDTEGNDNIMTTTVINTARSENSRDLSAESRIENVMEEVPETEDGKAEDNVRLNPDMHKLILEFYFEVSHFLTIYDLIDEKYVMYDEILQDGRFRVKLFCVDPSVNLANCMMRARASVLFSATMLPVQYYKALLGGVAEDYEVYAQSVFDPSKCGYYIARDVSTRYRDRNERQYDRIASYIASITDAKAGNYMVFCPSHAFLEKVCSAYREHYQDASATEVIMQNSHMGEKEREGFLEHFAYHGPDNTVNIESENILSEMVNMDIEIESEKKTVRTLIGFCVLGGIFSEGIDLRNDQLIGAIIVGTGYPQICTEREILRSYFTDGDSDGLNYAYIYPGMNKVQQAAGRVIRTADDVGIVVLLDDRFTQKRYQQLFPREWEGYEVITHDEVTERISSFWDGGGSDNM